MITFLNYVMGENIMVDKTEMMNKTEKTKKMNETDKTSKWRDYCNVILFGMVLVDFHHRPAKFG